MAGRHKEANGPKKVEAFTHDEKRMNIPTADAQDFVDESLRNPVELRYPRDTTLDPQLVWKNKDQQDAEDLVVEAPPLFIQEKVDPRVLIEDLHETTARAQDPPELTLFESFDGLEGLESIEFYKHAANWSNRLILGDSLQVMGSLAERENLRGQVQMVYMDPPYGIRFGSNWQVSVNRREVKDRLEDATREIEQIKAFRDTWELGVSSYLAYLRDRLTISRDLLTESGSVFVQIGDENVHLVRSVMDEVFGSRNYAGTIAFYKTSSQSTAAIQSVFDYILVYAKDRDHQKLRQLFVPKTPGERGAKQYTMVFSPDLRESRRMTKAEIAGQSAIPDGWRIGRLGPTTSSGHQANRSRPYVFAGTAFSCPPGRHWSYDPSPGGAMDRLAAIGRLRTSGKSLATVLLAEDNPVTPLDNVWLDTGTGSFTEDQVYVVQTGTKVLQRCMLMVTDPGDLVLDPTCGSGTTAVVAEQWGRRWITIDTSRVALTLARQRMLGAKYPYFMLLDSSVGQSREREITGAPRSSAQTSQDVRKGFVYRRVPHITLKSIAENPEITPGMSREQIDRAVLKYAESEILYDQPHEDESILRVTGRFTVESLSPHRAFGADASAPASEGLADVDSSESFEEMLLENLHRAGVQNGRKSERFEFDQIERLPGKYLVARATPRGDLAAERVAISVGPRYGTVGADWIKGAAREAMKGQGHDVLLVLGFAFDPRSIEMVQEFKPGDDSFAVQAEHQAGGIRILLVRMNADLAMGETLLKKTKAANLFTVFGEPDVSEPQWTEGGWVVTIRGFDVYNPVTGEIRPGDESEIAMWMIDTDYNEESFFVRHAYFLGNDPYDKLKKALKAEINEEAWASMNSATSRPFAHPTTGKIAIKVINHYGDELLTVLDLPTPPGE